MFSLFGTSCRSFSFISPQIKSALTHFIQMDDELVPFGHQPHALLSRPDFATNLEAAGFPADN